MSHPAYNPRVDEICAEMKARKKPAKMMVSAYDPRGNSCRELVYLGVEANEALSLAQAEIPGSVLFHVYAPVVHRARKPEGL